MAGLKVEDVLNIPGRIALSPTDLTADFPHGGTALGFIGEAAWRPNYQYRPWLQREKGQLAFDMVEVPTNGVLVFLARQWDPDVISQIYPTTTSQTDGSELATLPGGKKNRFIGGTGLKLVYSPLDTTRPGLLVYNAIPTLSSPFELVFGRAVETVHLVTLFLLQDSSGRMTAIEKMENLQAVLS